ncbi:hypothetical protein GCWU000342_01804 [Shuttleworthella satelles DSM 14600]|uniref:Uncharacterized protein n=1 Tax=Shuttleworthella satelles DSM 14600 TaxID=626523 RepID=C4GCW0_9FIRM|nr:hypothetical protein GCWU000342_01804 [Shuttleworthia satelles DSM 14600]
MTNKGKDQRQVIRAEREGRPPYSRLRDMQRRIMAVGFIHGDEIFRHDYKFPVHIRRDYGRAE